MNAKLRFDTSTRVRRSMLKRLENSNDGMKGTDDMNCPIGVVIEYDPSSALHKTKRTVYNTATRPKIDVNPSLFMSRIMLSGHRKNGAAIRITPVLDVTNAGSTVPTDDEDISVSNLEKMSPNRPVYMILTRKHWQNTIESTIHAVFGSNASDHNPLNDRCPLRSHDLPINVNVCADIAARQVQTAILGTHPVPLRAFPAANVKIPAPATLLERLKMDVKIDALPLLLALDVVVDLRLVAANLFEGWVFSLVEIFPPRTSSCCAGVILADDDADINIDDRCCLGDDDDGTVLSPIALCSA